MARYTTQVKTICESLAGIYEPTGYEDINSILEVAAPKIFDFDFPIFDETYRDVLCKKILKKFYTREIGQETYGLWKLRLEVKLNELMPKYNKLYLSELLEFDPLTDTDYELVHDNLKNDLSTTQSSGEGTQSSQSNNIDQSNTKNKSESYDLYSDTPQNGVNGLNAIFPPTSGEQSDAYQGYLTNASKNVSDSSNESDSSSSRTGVATSSYDDNATNNKTSTELLKERMKGRRGSWGRSPSQMLIDWRKTFINVDSMLFEELDVLFIQLFD